MWGMYFFIFASCELLTESITRVESNHVLILAVSPLHFSQPDKTVFDLKTILSSETNIISHDPPILAHTKVSVYLTGFRNTI